MVAKRMKRNSIGIEIIPDYLELVQREIQPVELFLLDPKAKYEKTKPENRIGVR